MGELMVCELYLNKTVIFLSKAAIFTKLLVRTHSMHTLNIRMLKNTDEVSRLQEKADRFLIVIIQQEGMS